MDEFALAFSGVGFKSPRGQLALWTPGPALLVVRLSGVGDKRFAAAIVREFLRLLEEGDPVRMFFDTESMATYDSELRTALTGAFLQKRAGIAELQVLVGSKLTAMGVSVANLALGGIIITHARRQSFTNALDAALAAAHVSGFTSDTLAAPENG